MDRNELTAHIASEFQKHFGRTPRWIVAAPGRVNVIGEHTDYNDGFVLPMAIERYAIMAADLSAAPGCLNVYDASFQESATIDISGPVTKGQPKWSNYIRGVLAGFQNRGDKLPALDVAFMSTVPMGGGLSSSAALEVCTATLLEAAALSLGPAGADEAFQSPLHDVSFNLRRSEILGIYGLLGAGKTELLESLAGARRLLHGSVVVKGVRTRVSSVADAAKHGIVRLASSKA